LPVVTTSVGARGIERARDIFVLAGPNEFHQRLGDVLESAERSKELARMARSEVERRYSWEQLSPRLGTLLRIACRSRKSRPYFSVVVPAAEEADCRTVMDALAGQTFADFETVVAGPGETLRANPGANFQFVSAPERDLSMACNIGADVTTGRMIAFLGQGCTPEARWLECAHASFEKTCAAVLEGRIQLTDGAVASPSYFSPDNLFFRRNAFHALGGFRTDSADMDWVWRAQPSGAVTAVEAGVSRQPWEKHQQVNSLASKTIGWISSWNAPCGIAEYSRHLLDGLRCADPMLRVAIFCDSRTTVGGSAQETVDPCWTVGTKDIKPIVRAMSDARLSRLVIQHHPGLLPWPSLCDLLGSAALPDMPILITLHNTQETVALPPQQRSRLTAVLKRAARIFVHTMADLDRLESLGLSDSAIVFPHGGHVSTIRNEARQLDERSAPIIGCFGFFFAHKRIHSLIEAVGHLRGRWPGLRLRLVNAAFPRADSEGEVRRCRETATRLGLRDSIEWFTDFIGESEVVALLSETDLIVLPYAETPESASGALRVALASGTPVAVSQAAIFDEAEGATARLSGPGVAELARSIEAILGNVRLRSDLQHSAADWLYARRWAKMGAGLLHHLRRTDDDADARITNQFRRDSNTPAGSKSLRVPAQ
jgi:glycosyltransferase involved in cell wall biosynthesis